jgi:[ribosomal protein S18]-alanine N-acetyltransferase
MQIQPFTEKHRTDLVAAFKSNMPQFFATNELPDFEAFLDKFLAQTDDGKGFERIYYYVIVENDVAIGAGGFGFQPEKQNISLIWGLVQRDFHKKGFGKALLLHRLTQIKTLLPGFPVVIDTTQHTTPFYTHFGFITEKITPNFYAEGMHRHDMRLNQP